MKKHKVKPSRHFQEGQNRAGHDISLDEAKAVIDSPDETEMEDGGRLRS